MASNSVVLDKIWGHLVMGIRLKSVVFPCSFQPQACTMSHHQVMAISSGQVKKGGDEKVEV